MNIIIAGAGKVGFNLAKTLSIGYNVTIIDKNKEALQRIQESLDILPIDGDVEDAKTYENFTNKKIDLFIAVTNIDNVNLISVLVADTILDIERRFVRLQKQVFDGTNVAQKLSIDKLVFPLKLASLSIASLISYPKANNVKFFKYTQKKLISLMVTQATVVECDGFEVVGIERNKEFFIPQYDQQIELLQDDLVYFFGEESAIKKVCENLELQTKKSLQRCVVFGGDALGVAITKELLAQGCSVKIVEKDLALCELADEMLQGKATVINSKYASHDIFEEESLSCADMFIAATTNDEYNIIKSLEAKESGIDKVVAINNEMEYYSLMHSLGIIVVRGPKMSAYQSIMEEINSQGVVIQKSYCGARGVIFMRKIFEEPKLFGKTIRPPRVQHTKTFYIRNGVMLPLVQKLLLQKEDLLVVFTTQAQSPKMKQWIYEL